MAPKQTRSLGPARAPAPKGYVSSVYDGITSPENRSVVTAVAFFAAGVAFLHSSWSEILLPPI